MSKLSTAPAAASVIEPELHIEIWPDDFVFYTGSAAQLRAEGLMPDGFEWPKAAETHHWSAGGFDYWLRRMRPKGHKGPMRSWLVMDNWLLRVHVTGRDRQWTIRRALERKSEDLRAMYFRQTAEGARQWEAACSRYFQALDDKRFQAFKALVPGLLPPKRGRRPKSPDGAAQAASR